MMKCKDCNHKNVCKYVVDRDVNCTHFQNEANIVPVTRCANCIHREHGVFRAVDNLVFWQCKLHKTEILLTDFCRYGAKE